MKAELSLFRKIPELRSILPKLPGLEIAIPSSQSSSEGSPFSPYIYNPVLVQEKTANIDALIKDASEKLLPFTSRFNSEKNLRRVINDILNTTRLTPEERKVLEEFETSILLFRELTDLLPKAGKEGLSEEFIKLPLAYLPHYFEWVYEWMDNNNLFTRYAENKETILHEKTKNQKHTQKVKPLTVSNSPTEKRFTGWIDKEPDEGNGLYITDIESVHLNGTIPETLGRKEVQLENLSELRKRRYGEIDIELPVDFTPYDFNGLGKVLPTHLGYKASAILFKDKNGNEIAACGITAHQDIFGITTITNIPKEAVSVKYRLKEAEQNKILEIPETWKKGIKVTWQREGDEVFNEAIKRSSSI